jgi:hypothetical protein
VEVNRPEMRQGFGHRARAAPERSTRSRRSW